MPGREEELREAAREAREAVRRSLGSPALFALVYSVFAGAIYFSLGVVADHALGLTPVVLLAAGLFFVLTAMTYVEGSSLHQERGGSAVFARHALNELWSFIAGWALLLDYAILIAIAAFAIPHYLTVFWGPLGNPTGELLVAGAVISYVAVSNILGISARRFTRLGGLALLDLALQALVIVLGLALVFDASVLLDPIELGRSPTWSELVYAFTIAAIAFIGVESAAGLAGEVAIGRAGLKRLVSAGTAAAVLSSVGIALVAVTALPVSDGQTALGGRFEEMPVLGVVGAYDPGWIAGLLEYAVGTTAGVALLAAASSGMLGLSRLAYGLATNRQIPSALGRLHPTRSTPVVVIVIAAMLSFALVLPADLEFLAGIYAFGVMLAFTIAHVSICILRYREPERDRPYRMPLSLRVGGGDLPLPAVLGALIAGAAWVSVVVLHDGARLVGSLWILFGLGLYLVYRTTQGKPIFKRVVIPPEALRAEMPDVEYDLILVPVFGSSLDEDIMLMAGRLASADREEAEAAATAAEKGEDEAGMLAGLRRRRREREREPDGDGDGHGQEKGGAVIEALYVITLPMSLPLDARIPDARVEEARRVLARAKAIGEDYEGVEVVPVMLRARQTGEAIVQEARKRNVEVIVLAAEEPSRIRGGALLGGRSGPMENFVGEVTKYVVNKAPCRIILTAPSAPSGDGAPEAAEAAQRGNSA